MLVERRVYIVDDDEAVRDSLSVLLESRTYAVKSFGSAPEFLTAAPSLPLGCLIVDIRMPGMDGLELQQRLIERALDFPLIVITGHGDVPLAGRAISSRSRSPRKRSSTASALRSRGCLRRVNKIKPRLRPQPSWHYSRHASGKYWRGC